MTVIQVAAEIALTTGATAFIAGKINPPYPFNSAFLDCVEGLSILTFIPAILTTGYQLIARL